MAVNFIPAAYPSGGVMPSSVGPAAAPNLGVASPLAGLLSDSSGGSADPGMMKLAQALLAKRMKPPTPGLPAGGPASLVPVPGQPGVPAAGVGIPPGLMGPPS